MPWSWVEFNLWSQSVNKSFYMASVLLLWWTYLQDLSWYLFDSVLAWIQKYHMCIAGVARYVCFTSFKLKPEDVSVPLSSESWLFSDSSVPFPSLYKLQAEVQIEELCFSLQTFTDADEWSSCIFYGIMLRRPAQHLTPVLMGCLFRTLLLALPSEEKPPDYLQVAICRISVISLFML